jgi:alginate O-acetyltransferase complex protein AlgI
MQLLHISVFAGVALTASLLAGKQWRNWIILVGSVLALFWLQPATPIRNLDFWLPLFTLTLTVLVWLQTRPDGVGTITRDDVITLIVIAALVLFVDLVRYFRPLCCITPSRPPQLWLVALSMLTISCFGFALGRSLSSRSGVITGAVLFLLALLIVLKTPTLAEATSGGLRLLMQQAPERATGADIRWLGISYVFFRLVATLRDHQLGRLPALSLREFSSYIIFFPTITAGPIERPDRFAESYRKPFVQSWHNIYEGGRRIVLGLFKKYVLADTLALFVLNDVNATQVDSSLWLWVMLYAYAFRLYLDFAGYTDVAIGLAHLLGITIPENFDKPYRKPNLTAFWNSWHITLALWFRAYYFNPVSRGMISRWRRVPTPILIAISQITTMVLVGLWHGVTLNYLFWGVWHGIGLFAHNRWASLTRTRLTWLDERPHLKRAASILSVAVTFHYVVLGWVWFALGDLGVSWRVFLILFGLT